MTILADPRFFTRAHYEAQAGRAPAPLCELVVRCLELVSQLSHAGLSYRFKGGNSLLVLLEDPQRFSIDVDIVTTEPRERLEQVVPEIAERCPLFTRWESRAPKTKPWLPMISFKLFFESVFEADEDPFVMLDVVLEPAPYDGITRPVRCGDIYASDQTVEVPSVSGLIGDKLLTLGPETLGIPIGKGKAAHRLKHVFDVATLCRQGYDVDAVRASVRGCMAQENRIQRTETGWEEVRVDTLRFVEAALADEVWAEGASRDDYQTEIVGGFEEFRQVLFGVDYTRAMLQRDLRTIGALVGELGAL